MVFTRNLFIPLIFMTTMVHAETLKTIFNPSFGGPDFYTALSSSTLPSGSTQYIQNRETLQAGATFYVSSGTILGTATIGGVGGLYGFAVGSGNGTIGFNSDSGYAAGVTGFGGLLQFTLNDGKLIYYNESNVSAGSAHGHTISATIDASRRFGLGTSSPVSVLDVIGATSDAFEARFSTDTSRYHVAFSTNGHILAQGGTPVISSCGVVPNGSVVGNDITGVITVGGGVVTSCILTFAKPYETNAPTCITNDATNILFTAASTSVSSMTVRATAGFAGDAISYLCIGRQ